MLEPLFRVTDTIAAFLWIWLGIRRRWLLTGVTAVLLTAHLYSHTVYDWAVGGLYLLFAGLEYLCELHRPPARCNELSLHTRKHIIVTGWLLVMGVSLVSDVLRHEVADFAKSLSCVLWVVVSNTLIPTGPRRRVKLPQLLPAPVVT